MAGTPPIGSITWADRTVPDADAVRTSYSAVVGWGQTPLEMGGYSGCCINEPGSGSTVADLDARLAECRSKGGMVVREPGPMGPKGRFAVIQDPAGAVAALIQPPA
jgi:predicted enzyme related to lactoylglutathione lyase